MSATITMNNGLSAYDRFRAKLSDQLQSILDVCTSLNTIVDISELEKEKKKDEEIKETDDIDEEESASEVPQFKPEVTEMFVYLNDKMQQDLAAGISPQIALANAIDRERFRNDTFGVTHQIGYTVGDQEQETTQIPETTVRLITHDNPEDRSTGSRIVDQCIEECIAPPFFPDTGETIFRRHTNVISGMSGNIFDNRGNSLPVYKGNPIGAVGLGYHLPPRTPRPDNGIRTWR